MERKTNIDIDRIFGDREALELHQLRLLEWMATTGRKRFSDEPSPPEEPPRPVPAVWKLTQGIKRYAWQDECIRTWQEHDGRGTVKVVTGGGKTLLGLSIAETVQNYLEPELRLVVVVPTIVLMHQWHAAILEHGNLPRQAIGRLGGGYEEDLGGDHRILIAVLASATKQLPKLVKKAGVGQRILLIADECHRAGAKEMSNVFKTERRWSLGLSATPEREDDIDADYDKSVLGKQVGPIICDFNLADAVREGLVPKFVINHYGLPMTAQERSRYETLSRSITDAMSQLRAQRDVDGDFFAWARSVATRNKGELGAIALRFVSETSKRRELLNHLQAREQAVETLLQQEFAVNKDARVILFHESINEVMKIYVRLRAVGLDAIMEHSELPDSYREKGLDLFRSGAAKVIVSARSLIEGFNVPAVDVAIIVASSNSVRQRIQSLGRVLRRHRTRDGEEKTSCIHVLYAADSAEEQLYGKLDWDQTTGVDRNRFFLWDGQGETVVQAGPPRTPLPTELQIDPQTLVSGSVYPGEYEGQELTCDTRGNISNLAGAYASDTAELAALVVRIKGSGGRFRITPKRQFVLVRVPAAEDWETIFVTQLPKSLRFTEASKGESLDEAFRWQVGANPGDAYPFGGLKVIEPQLQFKQKAGGVISKRVRGGEVFARPEGKSESQVKGANACRLIGALQELRAAGKKIGRISVNAAEHALYRENGQLYFIVAIPGGLEFPADAELDAERD
jgi:superfamily II DNA or RNA helicase